MGDEGAQYFSHVLLRNKVLTHLELCGNQIGPQGVLYLCQALEKNTVKTNQILASLPFRRIFGTVDRHLLD